MVEKRCACICFSKCVMICRALVSVCVTMAMTAGTTTSFPMSNHTRERVTVAKLTLENFYSNLIIQHEERETRYPLCFHCSPALLGWMLVVGHLQLREQSRSQDFFMGSSKEMITCEHLLPLHQAVPKWLRTSTLQILIWFATTSNYYYFVETNRHMVSLCSSCEVSTCACGFGSHWFLHVCHRE